MQLKKQFFLIVALLLSAMSLIYIENIYSTKTIEIRFTDSLSEEQKDKIEELYGSIEMAIFYEKNGEYQVRMMSGDLRKFRYINMTKGEFFLKNKGAVISENLVDKYLKSESVIGEEITYLNKKFTVRGVLKDDNYLYLGMDEEIIDDNWDCNYMSYLMPSEKYFEGKLSEIKNSLKSWGVEILSVKVYLELTYIFRNIIFLVFIALFWEFAIVFRKKFVQLFKNLKDNYEMQYHKMSLGKYLIKNYNLIAKTIVSLVSVFIFYFVVFLLIREIKIIGRYIPEDFLSVGKIIDSFKVFKLDIYKLFYLGFNEYEIDVLKVIVWDFLCIGIIFEIFRRCKFGKKNN